METQELITILHERGVIAGPDHFILGDGCGNPDKHSSLFIVEEKLYRYSELQQILIEILWSKICKVEFDLIISPNQQSMLMASKLAQRAARERSRNDIRAVLYSKNLKPTEWGQVLIHDDIINMGRQISEVIATIFKTGLKPVAISSLFTRINTGRLFSLPVYVSVERLLACYSAENCPLCEMELPINTNHGKGAEYLAGGFHNNIVRSGEIVQSR